MVEYGYIEDGYLRSKILEPIVEKRYNKDGEVETLTISVEQQIEQLDPIYKPVDLVDDSRITTDRENYCVRIVPYDAGDRISYRYVEVPDYQKFRNEIRQLKDDLNATDYKVIKCYEASLLGSELPYDIQEVHKDRQIYRDRINVLETELETLKQKEK